MGEPHILVIIIHHMNKQIEILGSLYSPKLIIRLSWKTLQICVVLLTKNISAWAVIIWQVSSQII